MLLDSANLVYWVLIGIGVAFFLLIIVSGGGDEGGDLDSDIDINFDSNGFRLDADLEADVATEISSDGDEFNPFQLLAWFGLGKAPLMILLGIDFSAWGIAGWTLNVILGSLTGTIPTQFFGLGGFVFFLSLFIGLWIGKLLSHPIGQIFSSFGEDVKSERLIGCVGIVTSKTIPYLIEGKIGQADVYDMAGNLVTISVSLPHWADVIPHYGQAILIIDRQEHSYIGISKGSSDEDKWINQTNLPKDS
ncbi:OB-fold-containig protein [Cyanothece sp. BG0011]|uniref:OB-fold-containig protein n=1 Tax=Cyanothece sp. BG0011 TaxID=2082950 RepID=UPI000D1DF6D3|nr:OB-fold-containig protein [Cyanothece sp. BG0011]